MVFLTIFVDFESSWGPRAEPKNAKSRKNGRQKSMQKKTRKKIERMQTQEWGSAELCGPVKLCFRGLVKLLRAFFYANYAMQNDA